MGAVAAARVAILLVDEVAARDDGDIIDEVVVQRRGDLPCVDRCKLRRAVAAAGRRVVAGDVAEPVRQRFECAAGAEFIRTERSEAILGAGQADEGSGRMQAVVGAVPLAVRLQPPQVAIDHAATERMADEIHPGHAQVGTHVVDEAADGVDVVAVHPRYRRGLVVFAEVIAAPQLAILVAGLLQEAFHDHHPILGMHRIAAVAVHQDDRAFPAGLAVPGLVEGRIAAETGERVREIAGELVHVGLLPHGCGWVRGVQEGEALPASQCNRCEPPACEQERRLGFDLYQSEAGTGGERTTKRSRHEDCGRSKHGPREAGRLPNRAPEPEHVTFRRSSGSRIPS